MIVSNAASIGTCLVLRSISNSIAESGTRTQGKQRGYVLNLTLVTKWLTDVACAVEPQECIDVTWPIS